jgi:hypothetical protein
LIPAASGNPAASRKRQSSQKSPEEKIKIRLVVALVGLAIGFALPIFAQEQNTVDPEVRQQMESLFVKLLVFQPIATPGPSR